MQANNEQGHDKTTKGRGYVHPLISFLFDQGQNLYVGFRILLHRIGYYMWTEKKEQPNSHAALFQANVFHFDTHTV